MCKQHRSSVVLACVLMLFCAHGADALIPEPDNKFYGRAFLAGAQLTASHTDVTIILKVDGNVLASYRMGENPAAQDSYILSVPLDSLEPQAPDTARTGDVATISAVANGDETVITTVNIGPRGAVTLLDISTDADEDGVLDISDAFPLDPLESVDTDGDGVGNNGDTDDDNDGSSDASEIAEDTDRLVPDVKVSLQRGVNFIALPIDPDAVTNSSALLREFATTGASIRRHRSGAQPGATTSLQDGTVSGEVFTILPNEGYELSVEKGAGTTLTGLAVDGVVNFEIGPNLVGFSRLTAGTTAFDLLVAIGDPSVVSSITRFDYETGRFQTVAYQEDQPRGSNFPISRGEAYWIFMKARIPPFLPP